MVVPSSLVKVRMGGLRSIFHFGDIGGWWAVSFFRSFSLSLSGWLGGGLCLNFSLSLGNVRVVGWWSLLLSVGVGD